MSNKKPLLVPSNQGLSCPTVEYNGRLLYSKYSPVQSIKNIINNKTILPDTIICIFSPVLWYGFQELNLTIQNKNCLVVAYEADPELYEFAKPYNIEHIPFFSRQNILDLDSLIREKVQSGNFKRVDFINFCSSTIQHKDEYTSIFNGLEEIVSTFWKNRITISKLGKLYCKNIFRNLPNLSKDPQLGDLERTVSKPILVIGAGESCDLLFEELSNKFNKDLYEKINSHQFYIICVDVSLNSLLQRNIIPDAVVNLESQFAIEKAYLGSKNIEFTLFTDLTSRPTIVHKSNSHCVWFATKFDSCNFLKDLHDKKIIKDFLQPMGSVGIAAVEIASRLRVNSSIPVYISGLDFCYSTGTTHAKGTPARINLLLQNTKLCSPYNLASAFNNSSLIAKNLNGTDKVSSKIMKIYACDFKNRFASSRNIFLLSNYGLDLGIPVLSLESIAGASLTFTDCLNANPVSMLNTDNIPKNNSITDYLTQELESIKTIKDLLINGENSIYRNDETLNEQLTRLIQPRDYLYFHFADGYHFTTELSFLKRVRAELDFYIKQINLALNS